MIIARPSGSLQPFYDAICQVRLSRSGVIPGQSQSNNRKRNQPNMNAKVAHHEFTPNFVNSQFASILTAPAWAR